MQFKPPLPTFFSYAHEDRKHLDALIAALAAFRRRGDLDNWDDRNIRGGQQWKDLLKERAYNSRMFLLYMWPRQKACQHIRDRVREVVRSFPSSASIGEVIRKLTLPMRGRRKRARA